jgi:hypothetical protein
MKRRMRNWELGLKGWFSKMLYWYVSSHPRVRGEVILYLGRECWSQCWNARWVRKAGDQADM